MIKSPPALYPRKGNLIRERNLEETLQFPFSAWFPAGPEVYSVAILPLLGCEVHTATGQAIL